MSAPTWNSDCLRWRGRKLTGRLAHYCDDWDGLPVDETTPHELCCCACALPEHNGFPPWEEVERLREQALRASMPPLYRRLWWWLRSLFERDSLPI